MENNQKIENYFEQTVSKELPQTKQPEYKDKLVQFFSILIEIDQKSKRKSKENGNKSI